MPVETTKEQAHDDPSRRPRSLRHAHQGAWGKQAGVGEKVTMLADGNGDFVKALGLTMDASKFGMGTRGQRFSMLVRDGKVEQLNVEEPGAFQVSSADYMIEKLGPIVC
jgi:peroxiredoxin